MYEKQTDNMAYEMIVDSLVNIKSLDRVTAHEIAERIRLHYRRKRNLMALLSKNGF